VGSAGTFRVAPGTAQPGRPLEGVSPIKERVLTAAPFTNTFLFR